MKMHQMVIRGLALSVVLSTSSTFVHGQGIGVGLGAQSQVGVGTNTRVQAPGANVGVKAGADVNATTSSEAKTRGPASNIGSRIESNSNLAAKLQGMLPSGTSIKQAASGFRNEGQFISALHASHNLDIPFDALKAKMTGESSMSLGGAIRAARPDMTEDQAKAEAKKAEADAKQTEKK